MNTSVSLASNLQIYFVCLSSRKLYRERGDGGGGVDNVRESTEVRC